MTIENKNLYSITFQKQENETIYSNISKEELLLLYQIDNWNSLGKEERLDLYQETVNRQAKDMGQVKAPVVKFTKMPLNQEGFYVNGQVYLNEKLFGENNEYSQPMGDVDSVIVKDRNLRAYNTCIHENIHAWQSQCIEGVIPCDPNILEKLRANTGDLKYIDNGKGEYVLGTTYINPSEDYYLYFLQPIERQAFYLAERRTEEVIGLIEKNYGVDESIEEYRKNLEMTSYEKIRNEAVQWYQRSNIEEEIDAALIKISHGNKNLQVDRNIEVAIKNAMENSYTRTLNQEVENSKDLSQDQPLALGETPYPTGLEGEAEKQELEEGQQVENRSINNTLELI